MVIKLIISAALGGIVGYEREIHERPAGLRTHVLVSIGATLFTLVSVSFNSHVSDPSRIAAQIVSGIGFLGAGTILRQGNIIRGLTTAASLWTIAGIGMAVGTTGWLLTYLAVVAAVLVIIVLGLAKFMEPGIWRGYIERGKHEVYLEFAADAAGGLEDVMQKLGALGVLVDSVNGMGLTGGNTKAYRVQVDVPHSLEQVKVIGLLNQQPGLNRFEWT
jgi:putative Mg2+ transporter-C (MgtC) family protein